MKLEYQYYGYQVSLFAGKVNKKGCISQTTKRDYGN